MATTRKTNTQSKMTIAETRAALEKAQDLLENGSRCIMCDTVKKKDKFYMSGDPLNNSRQTCICKECARKIALNVGKDGVEHECTKDNLKLALSYLNKPFLESVWNAAIQESENLTSGKIRSNVFFAYMHLISMSQYIQLTYRDSDIFTSTSKTDLELDLENKETNIEIIEAFEQNKKDAIRLLGYDPFVKELPSDQPFLYSSLIGYLDASEDANEDRMRLSSIIEIVKSFSHIEKINDIIANLMADLKNIEKNIATIKNLEATKTNITNSVLKLAADNGISLKNSVNASKGENTWTGKVRKMKEMNLREAEVNLYDTEYSAGLSQVADISNASILKQIRLDENDSADMLIQQRNLIDKYKKLADENEEKARILLRENIDLKSFINENGLSLTEVT